MQIKLMPESERPQEKLLFAGPSGLSNSELLALIIRNGTREKSAIGLAEDVLAFAASDVGELGKADVRELMKIDGIGAAKACSIVAALELSKRLMTGGVKETLGKLSSGDDVVRIVMQDMMYERRELFIAIFLNTKLMVESKKVISIGNLEMTPVHPREVFGPAVRRGAAAVVVAHNHPSGDPTPSPEDIAVTNRLIESSHIIGVRLIDHVIVGKDNYVSLRDQGYIPD